MRSCRPSYLKSVLLLAAVFGALALLVVSPAWAPPISTTVNCAPYGHDDLQNALDSYLVITVRGTCFGNFTVSSSGKTIQGGTAGAGINGRGNGPDLSIAYGMLGTVAINNMTFTNGYADSGGGIYLYGPIAVNLTNSTVKKNRANYGGGGIYAGGGATLNLTGTTVTGNSAGAYGGGVYVFDADFTAVASTISKNDTQLPVQQVPGNGGGGVYAEAGDVSLTSTRVTANQVNGYGGGIAVVGEIQGLCAVVTGSVCVAPTGKQVDAQDEPNLTELTLANTSVDHNTARYGDGGGIYSASLHADTSVTVQDSIVSFNYALGGDGPADGGGVANYGECGFTAGFLATGTAFQGNQARTGEGGGLYNATGIACPDPGTAIMTIGKSLVANGKSVVNSNQAMYGGGVANEQDDGVASLSLQPGATLQGNKASVTGGGLYNECGSFSSFAQIMLNSPNNVVSVCVD